jgi:hypothetical protein
MSQDCFVCVGTISCHVGVCESIESVTVSCFNGVLPHLLDQEAKTCMVEANECTNAGEVECSRVEGRAGCLDWVASCRNMTWMSSQAALVAWKLAGARQECWHGC